VLFALLAELDANMSNTYRFLQSAPNWIPLVSQAYISVLFYVHAFRVARESNVITTEQFQLLQWFESVYDFRTMMIPGPLVPVFQSMAYVSGPFEWIGNISPMIPDTARPVRNNSFAPNNDLTAVLPSVPLIVDQIQWFLSTFNITAANEHFITDNFYSDVFGVPAAPNAFGEAATYTPAARFLTGVSTSQYRAFKSQATSFRFPPRLAQSAYNTYMNWFEALRFKPDSATATLSYQWFSTMSATMQRYCQFVRGSVPMSAISLTGLGANSPLYKYQPATDLDTSTVVTPESSYTDPNNNILYSLPHTTLLSGPRPSPQLDHTLIPNLKNLPNSFPLLHKSMFHFRPSQL